MSIYKVTIFTGRQMVAEATNSIFLTLMGSKNQSSEKTLMNKSLFSPFKTEISFNIHEKKDLGNIVQVKLQKQMYLVSSPWFCKHITVQTPTGDYFEFPFYRWLVDDNEVIIKEGTARLHQDDTGFKWERTNELESKQKIFRWKEGKLGFPQGVETKLADLPREVRFDGEKKFSFAWNIGQVLQDVFLDKMEGLVESWTEIADFEKILARCNIKNTLLENVMRNWNKDYMFGYQFLNGCNPVMIRKCTEIPGKFPVTQEMVEGSLKGRTLQDELQAGNIYIVDYEILEDVPAASQRYLTAPICLLYKNALDQIVPIAIQLSQTPGEKSPIFLPSDNEYDWMLAKMFVKSSDFNLHQLVTHLLKTHLLPEVFEIAMYRQLSSVHPIYKLLIPHVRFTIEINELARTRLISKDGVFCKFSSLDKAGMDQLMKKAMKTLTYKSLCFPEDISARGMEDVPNYYYRDDGLRIWEAIKNFVSAVVKIYYDSDARVQGDVEIQNFVKDVACVGLNKSDRGESIWSPTQDFFYKHGQRILVKQRRTDFPEFLESREELIEYLTVVIFTASAQHAAVNFGQYDWYGWVPNSPSTMRRPPPQQKGKVDMKHIMDTLPDRECSSRVLGTVWALSRTETNERYLGMYPDMHFTEKPAKQAIKTFRKKLDEVTEIIKTRNEELLLGYYYLSPDKIPNSVAI